MSFLPEGFVENAVKQINEAPDCRELEKISKKYLDELNKLLDQAKDRLEKLFPLGKTFKIRQNLFYSN
jgi:hypothetical protein